MEKTPGWPGGRRQEGASGGTCKAGQGEQPRAASLNHFRGLWAEGVVSGCPAAGPQRIKAEEYCLLGTGQKEEVHVCLWIGYLHIKDTLQLGPSLPLRIGWPRETQSLPARKAF